MATEAQPDLLKRHLGLMRVLAIVFLVVPWLVLLISFFMPRLEPGGASPTVVTLVAYAASLWIGFTANRDARQRLERIRRHFAVHGVEGRLLRDHRLVYLVILIRLSVIAGLGLVVSIWGNGPKAAIALELVCGILIGMTWPTLHKSRLLLQRACRGRDEQELQPE
jgi:hypothetical protein